MIVLLKKGELLFVKCNLNLKRRIKYQTKVFEIGNHVDLLLPEEVMHILTENGNIRIWNGKKFIKLNLGQFSDIIMRKEFKVELFIEPKKQTEEPKVEVKPPVVELPVIEEPKVKEEVVEPKVEVEEKEGLENKKKRHKQNQSQGGDK